MIYKEFILTQIRFLIIHLFCILMRVAFLTPKTFNFFPFFEICCYSHVETFIVFWLVALWCILFLASNIFNQNTIYFWSQAHVYVPCIVLYVLSSWNNNIIVRMHRVHFGCECELTWILDIYIYIWSQMGGWEKYNKMYYIAYNNTSIIYYIALYTVSSLQQSIRSKIVYLNSVYVFIYIDSEMLVKLAFPNTCFLYRKQYL